MVTAISAVIALGAAPLSAQPSPMPSAGESDPAALHLMQGFPVPPALQVRADDGSTYRFPATRWAFSHEQELYPTVPVLRAGAPSPLPDALRPELGEVQVHLPDGTNIRFADSFDEEYSDGLLVLHRGRIVYERYGGALAADGRHIAMSVGKSFLGALVLLLADEGKISLSAPIERYLPDLAASGFAGASVQNLLDMRTALSFQEEYDRLTAGRSDLAQLLVAAGMAPGSKPAAGVEGFYPYVETIGAAGAHGGAFVYATPNSVVLQWLAERVSGQPVARLLTERLWRPMGMEQEASILVDRGGTAFVAGGLNLSLRDLARFGEMLRQGGRWNGHRILPAAVVQQILAAGDPVAFQEAQFPGLAGGSYHNQWWHRADGAALALGVNGQLLFIDRKHELVVARFASNPRASNRAILPTTLPALDALASYFSHTH